MLSVGGLRRDRVRRIARVHGLLVHWSLVMIMLRRLHRCWRSGLRIRVHGGIPPVHGRCRHAGRIDVILIGQKSRSAWKQLTGRRVARRDVCSTEGGVRVVRHFRNAVVLSDPRLRPRTETDGAPAHCDWECAVMRTDRSPVAGKSELDAAIPDDVESQRISAGAECGEVEDLAEKNGGDAGDPVSLSDLYRRRASLGGFGHSSGILAG